MKAIIIDEIQKILFEVQYLTELSENRSVHFFQEVRIWIKKVQRLFINYRLPLGAQFATFNSLMLSIENDGLIPNDLIFQKTPSRAKIRRAAATIYMQKTVELMLNFLTQMSVMLNALDNRNNSVNNKIMGGGKDSRRRKEKD